MARKFFITLVCAFAVAWLPVTFQADPACAAGQSHAAERIRFSVLEERSFCVEFSEQEISGIQALRLTGLSVVTKIDPQFGEFVCKIGDVGHDASSCPASDGSFWAYFRLDGNGVWRPSSAGASMTKVRCGDGEGWAWFPRGVGPPPSAPASVSAMCAGRTCGQTSPSPGDQPVSTPPDGNSGTRSSPIRSGAARGASTSSAPRQTPIPAELAVETSLPGPAPSLKSPQAATSSRERDPRGIYVIVSAVLLALASAALYLKRRMKGGAP